MGSKYIWKFKMRESETTSLYSKIALLFSSKKHSLILIQARTELLFIRAKLVILILALLMIAWIPLDIAFMTWADIWGIVLARIISAIVLIGVMLYQPQRPSLPIAYNMLVIIFLVPMLFFWYANRELQNIAWTEQALFIKIAYAHLPILIAMLLSLFPLTAIEGVLVGGGITVITVLALMGDAIQGRIFIDYGMMWIQVVVTGLAVIAGMSQLHFMAGFIEHSTHDEITGCLKRDDSLNLMEALFAVSKRKKIPYCIVFIDLDHFKKVNDLFGHNVGDIVLKEAAQQLRCLLRHQDAIVRWGGEEFVCVLPGTEMKDIPHIFQRLTQGLGRLPNGMIQTASMGVAEYTEDGLETVQELVLLADQRMYAAKEKGRNNIMMKNGSFSLDSN
jgi:diguanylate cyclase (GGDEF)-like protein